MATEVTADEVAAVYPQVAEIIADALGCDTAQVGLEVALIDGLNAESIDFLDIVFRLERCFKVRIPRGRVIREARGALSEEEFEHKGYLTAAGLRRLREYMSEVPPERFPTRVKVGDVPRLFTVETFCRAVVRAQKNPPPPDELEPETTA
ncbi:MAG: acyl carrier protein [Deltaproteobacteria bacterium]|nr:acyl carrier protein [Deltaproteobacteria bacterium]